MKIKPEAIIGIIILLALLAGAWLLTTGDGSGPGGSSSGSSDDNYDVREYVEIVDPSGYLNSEEFLLEDIVGEKIILIDFMTYSCINCQRTFPYLNEWYEKYKDSGLEVVGIHTPEFAFEQNPVNVQNALDEFGIEFPVVLDNGYTTWRSYENRYWPRKYLIDINGNIVYDHIGEGAYDVTEMKIQELLKERMEVLGEEGELNIDISAQEYDAGESRTPEIYFGSNRNTLFGNGPQRTSGEMKFSTNNIMTSRDVLYLNGTWNIREEYARGKAGSGVLLLYGASQINIVAESKDGGKVAVFNNDEEIATIDISDPTLYTVLEGDYQKSTLRLEVVEGTVDFYTFTFGS